MGSTSCTELQCTCMFIYIVIDTRQLRLRTTLLFFPEEKKKSCSGGIRTRDILRARQTLYQLSHQGSSAGQAESLIAIQGQRRLFPDKQGNSYQYCGVHPSPACCIALPHNMHRTRIPQPLHLASNSCTHSFCCSPELTRTRVKALTKPQNHDRSSSSTRFRFFLSLSSVSLISLSVS